MNLVRRPLPAAAIGLALVASMFTGCGGGTGSFSGTPRGAPITISLSNSSVVVAKGGKPTFIQLTIMSTSETAVVSLGALPGGVQVSYAASDTNPSGLLTFTANSTAPVGTSMPILMVNSAGQTATLTFTLTVAAAMNGG